MVVPTSDSSPPSLWTRNFFAVICAQVAFNYAASTYLLMPKFLATALGASANDIGHVNAIPGLMAFMVAPFVGGFMDRVGRRPLVAAGAVCAFIASLAWMTVTELSPIVYPLQMLSGLSFMLTFNGSVTLVTDEAPAARLSQAIGVFGAANITMNALAPAIAEPVAERFGWSAAFGLAAAAAVVSLGLSRLVREPERPKAASGNAYRDLIDTFTVARRVFPNFFAMVACGAAFGAVFTFYQPWVLSQGAKQVSMFFVGFMIAAVVTRVGLGSIADRVGRRRVAVRSFSAYALVVAAMTQLTPSALFWFGLAFGSAHGFFYPALNALTIELTHASERGRAMALVNGAFHLGNTTSVVTFGWVAHAYGFPPVFVLAALVAGVGALTLHLDGSRSAANARASAT